MNKFTIKKSSKIFCLILINVLFDYNSVIEFFKVIQILTIRIFNPVTKSCLLFSLKYLFFSLFNNFNSSI